MTVACFSFSSARRRYASIFRRSQSCYSPDGHPNLLCLLRPICSFHHVHCPFDGSDLCLNPNPNVSRLTSLVRARCSEHNAAGFQVSKRHYRILEALALPGEEEAPVNIFVAVRPFSPCDDSGTVSHRGMGQSTGRSFACPSVVVKYQNELGVFWLPRFESASLGLV